MLATHILLALAATALVLLLRAPLAAAVADKRGTEHPLAELRRLLRKHPTAPAGFATVAPGLVLACDVAALLLVPTVRPDMPEPFGNLFAVFGLLGTGRCLLALAAFDGAGSAVGGAAASRSALLLAASGPAAALVVMNGTGGGSGFTTLHETVPVLAPLLLAASAGVLAWADLSCAPAPDMLASGPALALLRLAAAARTAAWLDVVAALLPPTTPDLPGQALLAWAVKVVVLLALLAAAQGARIRTPRPLAAPALATSLALGSAVLTVLHGSGA